MPEKELPDRALHDTIAEHAGEFYLRQVDNVAKGLREMADDLERQGKDVKPSWGGYDKLPSYGNAAHRVVHTLHWGVANLHFDSLIQAAADADYALRAPYAEEATDDQS